MAVEIKEPEFYTPEDIQRIFRLSRKQTYALINSEGFPKMKIGKYIRISKDALAIFVDRNYNKEIIL